MNELALVASDVTLGRNVLIRPFSNLYGCEIGDNSRVGPFVEVQRNARIGRNCKISSHSFVCEGVNIEDNVFIGHHVCFINDNHPSATVNGRLKQAGEWKLEQTVVGRGASVGSGSTILGGIVIGKEAIVGAGSVVTRDVPEGMTVAGNPARPLTANASS